MARNQDDTVVSLLGVTKKFGQMRALDALDLSVKVGEVHGFLGPNGAGKSTALRILLGQLRKTSGEARLFGRDPWKHAVDLHKRLSYVPGDVNFWPQLTGGEIIDVIGDLRGGLNEARRKELIVTFELDTTKKFRTYSKGNRQKVALVAALASDVELYVFDEPTSGLDPLMEAAFQAEVRTLKQQGKTILLSSHILAEVEALCDQVTIIRHGKVVESASLENLRGKQLSVMTVQSNANLAGLKNVPGVHNLRRVAGGVQFEIDGAHTGVVLKYLARYDVQNLTSQPPTLERLFLRHYDEPSAEKVVQ